jgi:AcrR family transcriptional regulator
LWQNSILEQQNAIPTAERISRRTLAKREAEYADEVRRLLDAGLALMHRYGTSKRPRVADIVAAAGLSNDAFYRHFPSKDALVAAIVDDGAERLLSYLDHQMAKTATPEEQVRRWVEGVLSQADPEIAATTLAVLWNGSGSDGVVAGRNPASALLATLLVEPFTALGSPEPELDASLAAHATLGKLADHLAEGTPPTAADVQAITDFLLRRGASRPTR